VNVPTRGVSRTRYRDPVPIVEIDVDELAQRLTEGGRLVDVRDPHEYEVGHVPGAVSVPLSSVPDELEQFRGDGPVFVICHAGGRSRAACELVADHDIAAVNVDGGTAAWIASGRDTVVGVHPS